MKLTTLKALGTAALISVLASNTAQAATQTRIVGGANVDISQFPSTVALLRSSALVNTGSAFQAQFCGGTLISSTWVLTAAHCLIKDGTVSTPDSLVVMAGTSDLNAPATLPTKVTRVLVHEDYRSTSFGNDIALLQLAEAAPAPAIAMNDSPTLANELTYIAGWGALENVAQGANPAYPSHLQGATVLTQVRNDCANLDGLYVFYDPDTQICAGLPEGKVDSCYGDSGGPLYTVSKSNTLRLAGVTSWGEGCAIKNQPGVYTDVLAFKSWIDQNMGGQTVGPVTFEDERYTSVGTRASATGVGASILFMPILMLLLCARFKPFVLFRK